MTRPLHQVQMEVVGEDARGFVPSDNLIGKRY